MTYWLYNFKYIKVRQSLSREKNIISQLELFAQCTKTETWTSNDQKISNEGEEENSTSWNTCSYSNTGGVYDADNVIPNFTGRQWYFQTSPGTSKSYMLQLNSDSKYIWQREENKSKNISWCRKINLHFHMHIQLDVHHCGKITVWTLLLTTQNVFVYKKHTSTQLCVLAKIYLQHCNWGIWWMINRQLRQTQKLIFLHAYLQHKYFYLQHN